MTPRSLTAAKARIFKALGHPTRLGVVEMLSQGERCVCEIVEEFSDSQATVSRHLDVLLRAGIVDRRKDGVKMIYRLALPCVLNAMPCIVEAIRKGSGRAVTVDG
jgi:ArsR family transcriptional regulator